MDGVSNFSREQKLGAVFLGLFALLTVGLGFLQMRNTLYAPFIPKGGNTAQATAFEDESTRLQQIDTDGDGLNDYEELTFYETSPYLPDTDSDGVNDKVEIDADTDPNCPKGQPCATAQDTSPASPGAALPPPTLDFSIGTGAGTPGLEDLLGMSLPEGVEPGFDIEELINNPAALRQILKQTGKIPDDVLSAMDDETLKRVAREALRAAETSTTTGR
ncbi:MAG: hypothetical protein AAB932_04975 [Patescibacteria group bacterium]